MGTKMGACRSCYCAKCEVKNRPKEGVRKCSALHHTLHHTLHPILHPILHPAPCSAPYTAPCTTLGVREEVGSLESAIVPFPMVTCFFLSSSITLPRLGASAFSRLGTAAAVAGVACVEVVETAVAAALAGSPPRSLRVGPTTGPESSSKSSSSLNHSSSSSSSCLSSLRNLLACGPWAPPGRSREFTGSRLDRSLILSWCWS